jgi:DNA polymerase-3 subunit delta
MAAEKPVVYILHGDDEFAIQKTLSRWIHEMGDPTTAELNISRLDGRSASEDDLRTATGSMPFLAERRMVIYTHPLARLGSEAARKRFLDLLDRLPATTGLVLVIEDRPVKKDQGWEVLRQAPNSCHWLIEWARQAGEKAKVIPFRLPEPWEMPAWIRKQAEERGGLFSPQGAVELARHVASDTRLASQEIDKLLTYVDFRRAVEADDVAGLVALSGQADVFEMVDALAAKDVAKSLQLLETLLEKQDPLSVLGMIVRQYRLVLLAAEIAAEGGGPPEIEKKLRERPFQAPGFLARKLFAQARLYSLPQLEDVYRRLLELDTAFKSGQEARAEFAAFVAEQAG